MKLSKKVTDKGKSSIRSTIDLFLTLELQVRSMAITFIDESYLGISLIIKSTLRGLLVLQSLPPKTNIVCEMWMKLGRISYLFQCRIGDLCILFIPNPERGCDLRTSRCNHRAIILVVILRRQVNRERGDAGITNKDHFFMLTFEFNSPSLRSSPQPRHQSLVRVSSSVQPAFMKRLSSSNILSLTPRSSRTVLTILLN